MAALTAARSSSAEIPFEQEAIAGILDLPGQLAGLLGAALTDGEELLARLLHRFLVRSDDFQIERVVDLAGEALGGAALHDLGVEHADDVGRAQILGLHRVGELLAEILFETHRYVPNPVSHE